MITYHPELIQGEEAWYAARLGILTASEVSLILTPKTLKVASNEKEKAHLYELLSQRVTRYIEPSYISNDMLRGIEDEPVARALYAEKFAPVEECGFCTNDKFGFTIGCSPDGLVRNDGGIEIKAPRYKTQIETILAGEVPIDHLLQVQTTLLVTERKWWDFVSYSAGLPMIPITVYPDPVIQEAIIHAATAFEARLKTAEIRYQEILMSNPRLVPTERRVEEEIVL